MCHYTHFTIEERELLRVLQAQGLSIRAIVRMFNRSPSSVSREFKINSYSNGTYATHHTDKLYRKRRKNCGRKPKLRSGAAREYVLAKMALRWSPEQIAGRAKRDKERPAGAENRTRFGHWESDTVLGMRKTGCFGFSAIPDKLKKSFTVDKYHKIRTNMRNLLFFKAVKSFSQCRLTDLAVKKYCINAKTADISQK